ncbi:hypothetical protein FKW77_002626 [Venturia effusa]|uniref:Uncharacterized protein n=1 Tax=Venturia effusa TaxID=50376 RepID=A0A517KZ80_9PEZI|nr:hypothetical protein FKW77_002626 [Venturia effusa]
MTFPNTKKVVAPKDQPKETNAAIIETRRGVKFQKFVSIQIQHGDDIHVLDPNFPLSNLVRFSPKAEKHFQVNGEEKTFTVKASAHIPYDSMPFHRVIDLIRRTSTSTNSGRDRVKVKVSGLSLSQIVQVFWFCQVLELTDPLNQDWIGDYIRWQFPKDQGVAQLDVPALNAILRLCSPQGTIHPAAINSMARKIKQGVLSTAELVDLAVVRREFPQFDKKLGGGTVPAATAAAGAPAVPAGPVAPAVPAPAPAPQPQIASRPTQTPAQQEKMTDTDFPPLGGGRR